MGSPPERIERAEKELTQDCVTLVKVPPAQPTTAGGIPASQKEKAKATRLQDERQTTLEESEHVKEKAIQQREKEKAKAGFAASPRSEDWNWNQSEWNEDWSQADWTG